MARSVVLARAALLLGFVVGAATVLLPPLSPRVHTFVRFYGGAETDPWGRSWRDNRGYCTTVVVSSGPDQVDDRLRWRHSWWRALRLPFPRDDVPVKSPEIPIVAAVVCAVGFGRCAAALLLAAGHLALPVASRRSGRVSLVWGILVTAMAASGARLLLHLLLALPAVRGLLLSVAPPLMRHETVATVTASGALVLIGASLAVAARRWRLMDRVVV